MIPIIGIVIVLGAIASGYMMEHGKFAVLFQPAELVIIFGAAIGTVVVANPLPTLIKIGNGIAGVFGGSTYTKALYLENLKMLYELFAHARKAGTAKLEEDVDHPEKSAIFSKYPKFMKSHHALHFLCDTLRTVVTGGVDPLEIDSMMEPCPVWELWPPYWALFCAWERSEDRKKKLAQKWRPRWLARFSASCFATESSDRFPEPWQRIAMPKASIWVSCAWLPWHSPRS
jgi:hypothetical protein